MFSVRWNVNSWWMRTAICATLQTPRFALKSPDMQRARNVVTHIGARWMDGGTVEATATLNGPALLAHLTAAGVRVESWAPLRKTLEDWYLEMTNPKSEIQNPKS